jgi:hypothetical protein
MLFVLSTPKPAPRAIKKIQKAMSARLASAPACMRDSTVTADRRVARADPAGQ